MIGLDPGSKLSASATPGSVVMILAVLVLAGCGTYQTRQNYSPQPGKATLDVAGTDPSPDARVLATVMGVRRKLPTAEDRKGVELTLRLENLADQPLRFNPEDTILLDAQLKKLPGPVDNREPVTLGPGDHRQITLTYELPPKKNAFSDAMAGLNLRVTVRAGQRSITRSITFRRIEQYYDAPYYDDYPYYYSRFRYRGAYDRGFGQAGY
jgi:hypothetical protein